MGRRGSRFADIVTVVVVLGVFLALVGIYVVPEFTKAEEQEVGVDVEQEVLGPDFDVERLQADITLQGQVPELDINDPSGPAADN